MIRTISIHNFQSHKHTRLNLSPGVNVIVGSSDQGKSAVLRALGWVVNNRPSGDAFRSDWGGDTVVEIEAENSSIVRKKTDKTNEYQLSIGGKSVNDTVFKAFGQDVPNEISTALNFASINSQSQLDSPFLLSSDWTPGRVAEYLNEAAGLGVIDHAMDAINSRARRIADDLKREGIRQVETEAKLNALGYIDILDTEVSRLEELFADANRVRRDEQELFGTVNGVKTTQNLLSQLPDYAGAAELIQSVEKSMADWHRLNADWSGLEWLVRTAREAADGADRLKWVAGASAVAEHSLQTRDEASAARANSDALGALTWEIRRSKESIVALQRTTRAERLWTRIATLNTEHGVVNSKRLDVEGALGGVYELGEIIEHESSKLKQLTEQWHAATPDGTCPLCAGTGKLW